MQRRVIPRTNASDLMRFERGLSEGERGREGCSSSRRKSKWRLGEGRKRECPKLFSTVPPLM